MGEDFEAELSQPFRWVAKALRCIGKTSERRLRSRDAAPASSLLASRSCDMFKGVQTPIHAYTLSEICGQAEAVLIVRPLASTHECVRSFELVEVLHSRIPLDSGIPLAPPGSTVVIMDDDLESLKTSIAHTAPEPGMHVSFAMPAPRPLQEVYRGQLEGQGEIDATHIVFVSRCFVGGRYWLCYAIPNSRESLSELEQIRKEIRSWNPPPRRSFWKRLWGG